MAKTPSTKLTLKHIIGYGAGDCGGCFGLYMVSMYMSRFLQVNLGVNEGILAIILLIWNIWDTVNDPMMGTIMDICFSKAKPGADKFRPWILASIPIMVIGMISFYVVPPMMGGGWLMLGSAFLLKIVFEAGYTMMNIGMGSLLGNMATNDTERATLSSARGFGSTITQLVGGTGIPLLLGFFANGEINPTNAAYAKTSVCMAVVMAVLVFIHYAWTEERNKGAAVLTEEEKEAEKFKIKDIWNIITKNRAFLALVLHSICICAVQALGQGASQYMYIDILKNIKLQSLASALSSILMIIILTIAPILTRKWDLVSIIRTSLACGAIVLGGCLAYTLLTPNLNPVLFVVWNAIGTACITLSVQMQWGLVAESIDYNEYLTGKRNEGTIYGFFSLSRRLGSTIANSLTVLVVAGLGYDKAAAAAGLDQAPGTITGIKLMVVGFPILAAIGSFCCFTFVWNINKDVRAKMAAWKEAKAAKQNQ